MKLFCIEVLSFAIITLLLPRRGDTQYTVGVDDVKRIPELSSFPVNIFNHRAIFYLDSDCEPAFCTSVCSGLELTGSPAQCSTSIMPKSCICQAGSSTDLLLNTTVVRDPITHSTTRVYQINNWFIYPGIQCSNEVTADFCLHRCRERHFREGFCLKLSSTSQSFPAQVCACKSPSERARLEGDRISALIAPFALSKITTDVAVQNSSVYLVSYYCETETCRNSCEQLHLANGICNHYMYKPACICDTGLNASESEVLRALQIRRYAGGIYTVNGWHLFEHDFRDKCNNQVCEAICKLWGFPKSDGNVVECFQDGFLNSCGCRFFKSDVPTEEQLAQARGAPCTIVKYSSVHLMAILVAMLIFITPY